MSEPKIKMCCIHCGSENVMRDAYAYWSEDAQAWELRATYDQVMCEDCGEEANYCEEVSIEP